MNKLQIKTSTLKWIKAAAVRATKTFFQTGVALLTAGQAITDFDWPQIAAVSATAAAISIGTSLANLPEVE